MQGEPGLPPLLDMRRIVKRFPGVLANDAVDFTVDRGEIHALLGENGAGKSTLMQILYGFYQRDAGDILVDGVPARIASPKEAIGHGIGMIHQEFMLIHPMTVVENVVLGLDRSLRRVDLATAARTLQALSDRHGLAVDPRMIVGHLPIGVQQRVEILKLLYRDARLLVLDEPTAVLTPREKDGLFAVLRGLARDGRSIVIVTHKLHEIMEVSDRVTVMRDGRVTASLSTRETSPKALARLMVGRDVALRAVKGAAATGVVVLRTSGLVARDAAGEIKLRGIDLTVHAGEILGLAGVDGNGQSQLAEAVMNLCPIEAGRVVVGDEDVTHRPPAAHHACGIAYVPADRRHVGSVSALSVTENAILGTHRERTRAGGLIRDRAATRGFAERLIGRFGVRAANPDVAAETLSGGNLQKLILGREMMRDPKVLVVEQPTRGLDVGAIETVWAELLRARAAGMAILLISAELDEIINLADRIAVIFEGRIMGIVDAADADLETIGLMMAGSALQARTGGSLALRRVIVRRLSPDDRPAARALQGALAVAAALVLAGGLFVLQGVDPLAAYGSLLSGAFGNLRGIGYSLNQATPLAFIALGTILAWRSGFGYLGFEGCVVVGAAAAAEVALMTAADGVIGPLPFALFLVLAIAASFAAGGAWAGLVGLVRTRFGGSEVLVSLMSNYVGLLFVQYLISGPMRAPGGLPQSERVPTETWLPFVLPGSRAHAGILLAVAAAVLVWLLLRKTPLGYEMIVAGLNPAAARYGGIAVGSRIILSSILAGGLGALAGMVELLGVGHRLVDGMSGGVGFIGIVVALLARLEPLAVIPTAILYGGMTVGANTMQRDNGIPSSIAVILQSLIVLMVMASELMRHYQFDWSALRADAGPGRLDRARS